MKRDMNLIRKILLEVEEGTPSTYYPNESALESLYPSDLIVHNALLILDAGWAIGTTDEANGELRYREINKIASVFLWLISRLLIGLMIEQALFGANSWQGVIKWSLVFWGVSILNDNAKDALKMNLLVMTVRKEDE